MMAGLQQLFSCFFLLVISALYPVVMASQYCSFSTYDYNRYDGRYELMVTYKSCQWGCCWKFEDPCCSLPVGLVIGCVVAGVLFVGLIILITCCCCVCRRRSAAAANTRHGAVLYPSYSDPAGTHIPMNMMQSSSLPPGVYAPPPSYEEVMAGETNLAFKHEN